MIEFYQNIPLETDPVAFSIGSFHVNWYAIMYIVAFFCSLALVFWRIKKNEDKVFVSKKSTKEKMLFFSDLFLVGFFGMILGGRLGYALLYEPSYFLGNPLRLFYPFDQASGEYVGISGMSYFGAVFGTIPSVYLFLRAKKMDFWKVADFAIPAISAGYIFGRIGNFINGELFGRPTLSILGMDFDGNGILRHPSQLYEAFFEGMILFAILWFLRNKSAFDGQLILFYFMAYSFFRFFMEFFREPDVGDFLFGQMLTTGQIYATLLFFGSFLLYFRKSTKGGII